MAEFAGKHAQKMLVGEGDFSFSVEEKWAKHYSSNHQILLVGEGDFSFSVSRLNALSSRLKIILVTITKRGEGPKPDQSFPLGKCSTFIFIVSSKAMKSPPEFPMQKELKRVLANINHVVAHWAVGLTVLAESQIPDLSPLPEDMEPSSSGVGTS